MQWWCSSQFGPWTWAWQPFPGVWLFLLTIAAGYARILRRTAGGYGERPGWRVGTFAAGLALLWIALDWPLGPLGAAYQLSLHMVQFLLIGIAAPALLLVGIPPATWRALAAHPRTVRTLGVVTHPLVAFFLFSVGMTLTHWPSVADTLMATQPGAFALDMAWLVAGLLFWWPVVAPVPKYGRFGPLLKMAYLGANVVIVHPPVVMLFYSKFPLYATYELATPVPWGGTPLDDQQFAGGIMKAGSVWIMIIAITIVFYRWHVENVSRRAAYPRQDGLQPGKPRAGD